MRVYFPFESHSMSESESSFSNRTFRRIMMTFRVKKKKVVINFFDHQLYAQQRQSEHQEIKNGQVQVKIKQDYTILEQEIEVQVRIEE